MDKVIRLGVDGKPMFVVEYTYLPSNTKTFFYTGVPRDTVEVWFYEGFRRGIDQFDRTRDLTDAEWKEYWWNASDQNGKRIRSWTHVEEYLKHYNK